MLTIPWFFTSTLRDLMRYPRPQVQEQQNELQQPQQQQQQQQPEKQQAQQQQSSVSSIAQKIVSSDVSPNNTTPLQPKPQPSPLQPQHVHQQQQQQQKQQQKQVQPRSQQQLNATAATTNPGAGKMVAATATPATQTAPPGKTAAPPSPRVAAKPKLGQSQQPPQAESPKLRQAYQESPPSQQRQENKAAPPQQTSKATLVLTPSVSNNRMGEKWAQEQVEKFAFSFDRADKDKSGCLSSQEVLDVLRRVGFNGSDEEAKFIFQHLDKNKDDKITRDEFKDTMFKLPKMAIREYAYRRAFQQLDKDKSGSLSKQELMDATKDEGEIKISAKIISDALVYLCEEDEDQMISYEEFLQVLGFQDTADMLAAIFKKLDTDGSGFLSKEEILDAVSNEHELKLKASKISDLLCYWCRDDDKKISYQEFVGVWLKQREQLRKRAK